jgi:hypothetical protein
VLASPQLASRIRAGTREQGVLGTPPVVAMTPLTLPSTSESIEA